MSDILDRRPERAFFARRLIEHLLEMPEFEVTLVHYKKMPDDLLYSQAREVIIPLVRFPYAAHFISFIRFCLTTDYKFDVFQWLVGRPYPFFWLVPAEKIVILAHDAGGALAPGIFTWAQFFFNLMLRYFHGRMDAVIGVSHFASREIVYAYHIPPEKVFTIYNGIDEIYKPTSPEKVKETLKRYGLDVGKYFLYIGGLQTHKNIPNLIKAYDLLCCVGGARVEEKLIVAATPSYGGKEVYEAANASKFKKNIIFLPRVIALEDMSAFYSGATALVYPSLHEGFGLPPLEAMVCGTPVVASFATSLPEVVGEAAILVDPKNLEDIMKGMKRILENPGLRDELREKGFVQARKFTWEKYAEDHAVLYKKIYAGYS